MPILLELVLLARQVMGAKAWAQPIENAALTSAINVFLAYLTLDAATLVIQAMSSTFAIISVIKTHLLMDQANSNALVPKLEAELMGGYPHRLNILSSIIRYS